MKNGKFSKYIYWGVTAVAVLASVVLLCFLIIKFDRVKAGGKLLFGILSPIIYGAVMAYLVAPIYNRVRDACGRVLEKRVTDDKNRRRMSSAAATVVSLFALIAVVCGLFSMMIPQLIKSVVGIVEVLPTGLMNLQHLLEQVLADNPELEAVVLDYYRYSVENVQKWLSTEVVPNMDKIYNVLTGLSSSLISVLNVLKNIFIGVIVMIYLLNMKEKLMTQMKMILYGVFPVRIANKVLEEARYVHLVFGGFIIGKLLDSLIIGILCFFCMSFMKMPYVLLVSVIIGVTNVIPFFGPFIGAIPSAFLILLVSPMKCLWFIVFIFLLQQFDGNILGPKILGNSTGISSFWVLFSILLFGGLFGFVGMIIGVPTFAVFYKLVTELVTYLLGRKDLAVDIESYDDLDYIDRESREYIKK